LGRSESPETGGIRPRDPLLREDWLPVRGGGTCFVQIAKSGELILKRGQAMGPVEAGHESC